MTLPHVVPCMLRNDVERISRTAFKVHEQWGIVRRATLRYSNVEMNNTSIDKCFFHIFPLKPKFVRDLPLQCLINGGYISHRRHKRWSRKHRFGRTFRPWRNVSYCISWSPVTHIYIYPYIYILNIHMYIYIYMYTHALRLKIYIFMYAKM